MSEETPFILLFNPKVASPGRHRLPLSLLHLGAVLEGRVPYEIVDGNLEPERDHAAMLIDRIEQEGIRCLGVTLMPGRQLQRAVPELRRIKAACPGLTVILGGFFPTVHPDLCAGDPTVDFVVRNMGESVLPGLLDALAAGRDPGLVPGLTFRRGGAVVRTPDAPPARLDDLPARPYHRVPVERYVARTFMGRRTLCYQSSMGCPFRCNFCAVPVVAGGPWHAESAARAAAGVQELADRFRIDALELFDSNFFVDEQRAAAFCEELLRRGLRLNWWAQGRIDALLGFRPETWRLMRDSGLRMIYMGAESADDAALSRMNKGGSLTVEKTLAMAAHARQWDIIPEYSFILGNLPDPAADILAGLRLIRRIKRINPRTEIILYRYDPVPVAGGLWDDAARAGFSLPRTLDEWADPRWQEVQVRRGAAVPWLAEKDWRRMQDFETVLNARFPSVAYAGRVRDARYALWRGLGAVRWSLGFFRAPGELARLQRGLRYERPDTSGF